ncbi:hypothetical protein HTV45_02860 [Streptomyces sp. CHD11]|nr:hypothetical protein [Streptomyces sp. CHD11]MBT3149863.1 hypothetical protein [Streptomyces sp. CHD11]
MRGRGTSGAGGVVLIGGAVLPAPGPGACAVVLPRRRARRGGGAVA